MVYNKRNSRLFPVLLLLASVLILGDCQIAHSQIDLGELDQRYYSNFRDIGCRGHYRDIDFLWLDSICLYCSHNGRHYATTTPCREKCFRTRNFKRCIHIAHQSDDHLHRYREMIHSISGKPAEF